MSKNRCFLPNCCSFCQAVSEEKIFRNRQLEKKLPVVAMFVSGSGRNEQSLSRTYHIYLLASFSSFGHAVSEEKIFKKSANQKEELPLAVMLVIGSGRNDQSLQRTLHRCFVPLLKCKMFTDGRQRMTIAHVAFGKVS